MVEEVILIIHPTRLLFLRNYIISFLLLILGLVLFSGIIEQANIIPGYFYLVVSAIGLVPLIFSEIKMHHYTYTITNHKLTERVGSLAIEENSVAWDRLSNYTLKQSAIDRIFGTGTIELWSIGEEESPEVSIKKVSKVKKIIEILDGLMKTGLAV